MKIILNRTKLEKFIKREKNLGFVPTMGALHLGHVSIIRKSVKECNKTLVTIFINKPQFNKKSDFNKYPRSLKKDFSILKKLRVNYVFSPRYKEIYPKGINKKIKISSFKKKLCGRFRKGHFEAVADVLDRFIKIIKPKKIYLGEKDMQQLKIMENFIKKNHPLTRVVGCKTIREKNGIPYSSRNILLNRSQKIIASKIYNTLRKNKKKLIKNNLLLKKIKNRILNLGASKIDYIEILNLNRIIKPFKNIKKNRIFIAYYLGDTRLIDNF